jgi:glycosyltransferase involved in cell wall biosynthesis
MMTATSRTCISGVTLAHQAVSNGYPVVESIRSMLPVCAEIVANVGQSDDGSREAVLGIGSPKIRLLTEPWDADFRNRGLLLSRETNRAIAQCTGGWILYLQADEVLHEDDLDPLVTLIRDLDGRPEVDGIQFRYVHFYGSPAYRQDHMFRWYTRAVRVVRNDPGIRSVGDALKFRRFTPPPPRDRLDEPAGTRRSRIRAVRSGLTIYHYGWARPPEVMRKKQEHFERLYMDDQALGEKFRKITAATIYSDLGHLERFTGTHPAVMRDRVAAATWNFDPGIDRQPPRWLRLALVCLLYPPGRAIFKAVRWLKSLFGMAAAS